MADYRRLISAYALVLAGLPLLYSQQAKNFPQAETFTVMTLPGHVIPANTELYYLVKPTQAVALTFRGNSRSEPILRDSSGPLVFAIKGAAERDNKTVYVPVTQTVWPQSTKKALVLFAMTPSATRSAGGINALAIDDAPEDFPNHSVKMLNFSGKPLLAKIGGFEGTLAAGPSKAIPFPSDALKTINERKMATFPIILGIRDGNEAAKVLFSGYIEGWPATRTLIIALPFEAEKKQQLSIKLIRDSAPEEKIRDNH